MSVRMCVCVYKREFVCLDEEEEVEEKKEEEEDIRRRKIEKWKRGRVG